MGYFLGEGISLVEEAKAELRAQAEEEWAKAKAEAEAGAKAKEEAKEVDKKVDKANGTESAYEIRGNLRFVKAYKHDFKTFAKRRWIGVKLIEVFTSEFKAFSTKYYTNAIEIGKITVNDKTVPLEYCVREGDRIVHSTIREETPVFSVIPQVLYENNALVAFEKPSSMPVHACGNFFHNTLMKICETELNYKVLMTVHRLDR